ncbi:unnamed protein product [Larinioides sclopetarius]|uniref:Uncharacterized protein n=1 Tax=Larinioides sclopetarius TaxID=280406 RepID=A0AAV1ZWB1_9ARAC
MRQRRRRLESHSRRPHPLEWDGTVPNQVLIRRQQLLCMRETRGLPRHVITHKAFSYETALDSLKGGGFRYCLLLFWSWNWTYQLL